MSNLILAAIALGGTISVLQSEQPRVNTITDERVIVRTQFPAFCQELDTWPVQLDSYDGICWPPPMPPIEDMPIYASFYNPALGGINCDPAGRCDQLATVPMRDSYYGHAAACPIGWTTRNWTTVINIPGMSPRACLDTGGAITITYRTVYTHAGFVDLWVIVIDFLERDYPPVFAGSLFWDWHTSTAYVPSWRVE